MGHAPRFQSVDYPAYTVITGDTTMILSSSLQRGLAALFLAAPVAALAVGPVRDQHKTAAVALIEIIIIPGIQRDFPAQVGTIPGRPAGIVFYQPFQRIRILTDVESVSVERGLQGRDLGQSGIAPRSGLLIENIGRDHNREHADDGHHHQNLNQGETCAGRGSVCSLHVSVPFSRFCIVRPMSLWACGRDAV